MYSENSKVEVYPVSAHKLYDMLLAFGLSIWSVFTPIHTLFYIVTALVGADLVTGVFRAVREKRPITSNRMRHTAGKLLGYYILLGTGLAIDVALGGDGLVVSRAIAVYLALVEATSLGENLKPTTGIDLGSILSIVKDKLKPPSKE